MSSILTLGSTHLAVSDASSRRPAETRHRVSWRDSLRVVLSASPSRELLEPALHVQDGVHVAAGIEETNTSRRNEL